ncbi:MULTISPECIES: alpha/beta hydrolase [unclassified Tolypothrix]|uniref:alpha/beta hydrolase n=1 Tax=unclassified Tolypothrix TaxID=2649714 RepID=UPI0005EAC1F8|nr:MULTISPECIES: alpha/beta hydrolase [unclassified Tolypothrix]BAY89429.1 phospholipase/carboxylesterase [Microchaete diplosiphon NIES-3275]EKF01845.1 phospholipase/carboxylesterase [Tolypothrix sp. PCC 7601]MBE9087356.1 alpha/beta hydrolase [Tolypothrix sp. LEGE 11397]UYD23718.1 alpha/beta hydrolase [Tolypothrix sp. PCC 7712]UYD34058.1 alpha/beta hydrolase [Tolypothrix sp. PCC 7601]
MTQTLEFISVPPETEQAPLGLIVTLHGWGANADDVASLLPFFDLPDYHFVFPNAPYPYPYAPIGRAWYDLRSENMYEGLPESRQILTDWLLSLENVTGVPLSRTVLSGFSQGAAMTLDVGLNLPLAGLVAMSGYLHPDAGKVAKNSFPPTLITHGTQDQVVPLLAAVKARDTLESIGVEVQYQEFNMGHEIGQQMLDLLRNFVVNAIA